MMNKITLLIGLFFGINNSYGQINDTTITWYKHPKYIKGERVIKSKTFNHIPTRRDSLEFGIRYDTAWETIIDNSIKITTDTLRKKGYLRD